MKLTGKQEKFAMNILKGMSQADAYRDAYPAEKMTDKTIHEAASRLMANSKVTARVNALKAPVIAKVQYGLEQAMGEAQEAFEVSKSARQGGSMVAAVQLRSKLNSLLVERTAVTMSMVEQMKDEQLDAFIASRLKETGVNLH